MIETMLFLHISAAIGLFIAIGIEWLMLGTLKSARSVQDVRTATAWGPIAAKLAPASAVVLVVMGISMVAKSKDFAFGDAWVVTALVFVVIVAAEAALVHGRRMEELAKAAQESPDGPLTEDLLAKVNDPVMQISAFTASFMAVGAVWIMTHQPGWAGSIGTVVLTGLIGAGVGVAVARKQVVPTAPIVGQRGAPSVESAPGAKKSKASVD